MYINIYIYIYTYISPNCKRGLESGVRAPVFYEYLQDYNVMQVCSYNIIIMYTGMEANRRKHSSPRIPTGGLFALTDIPRNIRKPPGVYERT